MQPAAAADGASDDHDACLQHLRHEWGEAYEANRQAAFKTRDFIFSDPADSALFDKVMDTAGNDPRLFSAFARLASQLPEGPAPAVNIADIPYAKREQMALVAASFVFPSGRLQENPILRDLASVIPVEDLINFGAKLHRKLFSGK
jgi:hypothetical protein